MFPWVCWGQSLPSTHLSGSARRAYLVTAAAVYVLEVWSNVEESCVIEGKDSCGDTYAD